MRQLMMARKGDGKVDNMKEAMKYFESTQKKKKKISAMTTKSMSPSHRGGGGGKGSRPSKGGGGQLSASDARMMRETIATDTSSSSLPSAPQKVFGQQTIWGQNIINCRSFSLEGRRVFEYTGSFVSVNAVPIYPLPEIAFLGRSNVGKSSLLNCITGSNKNIAVASKTPGRTRCINQFKCADAEGDICTFVDLPGYGFAKMGRDLQEDISLFLRQYLEGRSNLRMAILLIDARREPQEQDLNMHAFLEEEGIPSRLVATKTDKLRPEELVKTLAELQRAFDLPQPPVAFSSMTGVGRKDVWRAIRDGITGAGGVDEEDDEDEGGEEDEYNEDEEDF